MSEGEVESTSIASVLATCPVCRGRPRGARTCPRCGADLSPVQRCVLGAWRLRVAAREAVLRERFEDGLRLARSAVLLHATPVGRRLETLAQILARAAAVPAPEARPDLAETGSRHARPEPDAPPPEPTFERIAGASPTPRTPLAQSPSPQVTATRPDSAPQPVAAQRVPLARPESGTVSRQEPGVCTASPTWAPSRRPRSKAVPWWRRLFVRRRRR